MQIEPNNTLTLEEIVHAGIKLTPMMEQYFTIKKEQHIDTILFYRMGDFYEVFFDDAKKTSKLLNITLTHRGKLGNTPIPMAGIPHHAATTYIDRLTAQGVKVAICEQMENPKEAKGIVKRAVTQIVSPGLPYDLDKASSKFNHFVASAFVCESDFYLIFMDYTTGEFRGSLLESSEALVEELLKISPKELVTYPTQWEKYPAMENVLKNSDILLTSLAQEYFAAEFTKVFTDKFIPNSSSDKILQQTPNIFNPIGALCYYIFSTQGEQAYGHTQPFQLKNQLATLKITLQTLIGLEIFPQHQSQYKDSILGFFDRTKSSAGSRKLKSFFLSPSMDLNEINKRQQLITFLLKNSEFHSLLRDKLDAVRDIERILTKTSTKKASGGDLLNLAKAYQVYADILAEKLPEITTLDPLKSSQHLALTAVTNKLTATINDEIGASLEKGNLIREGAHKKRDTLAKLSLGTHQALKDLERRYRSETGIANLRVKSNNVAGYFVEVSKSHIKKIPNSFTRRQTLVNSERYVTQELAEFEKEVFSAKLKLESLEREIFNDLVSKVLSIQTHFLLLSNTIAYLDIMQSMAWVAIQENLVCPTIDKKKKLIQYKNGWHPLIKATMKDFFVPHSLKLDNEQYFALITGPNMAGKTTVMRSAAIIQFLAQLGSFVPCQNATLGICDYIFSRLGASDNILKGQSTFMVEMTETAEIIRHATPQSLIVLDEIGRGTSTYDGISLAWSLVEYFVKHTKAITLFATHYHELIELIDELPHAKNLTVETKVEESESGTNVQFLYNLIEQAANQSYGIYVAKLAGLPSTILNRSQSILKKLERIHLKTQLPSHQEQLTIFQTPETKTSTPSVLEQELAKLEINNLTPLAALEKLNELQQLIVKPKK